MPRLLESYSMWCNIWVFIIRMMWHYMVTKAMGVVFKIYHLYGPLNHLVFGASGKTTT